MSSVSILSFGDLLRFLTTKRKSGVTPTHRLSGWPEKSSNFIVTTKMVFPKSLKFLNSGSERGGELSKPQRGNPWLEVYGVVKKRKPAQLSWQMDESFRQKPPGKEEPARLGTPGGATCKKF